MKLASSSYEHENDGENESVQSNKKLKITTKIDHTYTPTNNDDTTTTTTPLGTDTSTRRHRFSIESSNIEYATSTETVIVNPSPILQKHPIFSKLPQEYIVDFYDAFSAVEEGGVGLMIEVSRYVSIVIYNIVSRYLSAIYSFIT